MITATTRNRRFVLRPVLTLAAVALLLIVGTLAAIYQYRVTTIERARELTVQANILAASVTASIVFNDRQTTQEYVDALMLDPRLDAAAIFNESHQRVAGFYRPGSRPIGDSSTNSEMLQHNLMMVMVPARQGEITVGRIYLRSSDVPLMVRLTRYSGVALLTIMAVLMIFALAVAQRALTRANAVLHYRAQQLADANDRLTAEMEQRSRTEEALRQSQKMEAVGQLSGGIAHDFNNLLMIIKSSLTLLERKLIQNDPELEQSADTARAQLVAASAPNATAASATLQNAPDLLAERQARYQQFKRYLQTAHDGIDKAANLTQRLLSFGRRQPLSPTSLDLDMLIRSMRPLLDHSVRSNASIEYQLHSNWPVLCDRNQMENAILNLAINARDAMPEGGRITISTSDIHLDMGDPAFEDQQGGDFVHLSVADTGSGMSEEVRRKAFDPFFTTKPVGKGTGLGLSTIHGYVMQSSGHIRIDSETGKGTIINIVLPRAGGDSTAEVA